MRLEKTPAMSLASEFRKHTNHRKRQTHCQAGHPFYLLQYPRGSLYA